MMSKRRVCVITGTRADYGLLRWVIQGVQDSDELELQLVVTGSHLSREFGCTYREIEEDGYYINKKIDILLSSDTSVGISKSMGLAHIGFAEAFYELSSDMVLVLGDRYEIFAAAAAALVARIPIAHIHGGEVTEGAMDESFRHSITKMSHLHFVATEAYEKRVLQLGEDPRSVFNVGGLGVDAIRRMELLDWATFVESLGCGLRPKFVVVTYHPVTLERATAADQFEELLKALEHLEGFSIILTKANADVDGRIINQRIDEWSSSRSYAFAFESLGHLRYLSALKFASIIIGNSSSGLLEAPSFKVPTINIGERQRGRIQAGSVINAEPRASEIIKAMEEALSVEFQEKLQYVRNPYDNGGAASKIVKVIKEVDLGDLIMKPFFDMGVE